VKKFREWLPWRTLAGCLAHDADCGPLLGAGTEKAARLMNSFDLFGDIFERIAPNTSKRLIPNETGRGRITAC